MGTKCPSAASPVAFWFLCRHGQRNSPPAGGETPPPTYQFHRRSLPLILSLILLTAVLYAQYRRSRALRRAARDLKEARAAPGTRLRLYSPDDKLEELLSQINGLLEDKERETRILRSREESLRRQIANVSHDLRTPLTSILGYLQLMGREDISPEEYRHCLEIVEGRAKVLQDLITSFYDLSRIEGGEYPPTRGR